MEQCKYCDKKMPKHIMDAHVRKRHPETLGKVELKPALPEEAKPEGVVDTVSGQSTVATVNFDKVIIYSPKVFMSPDREEQLLSKGAPIHKQPTANVRDVFRKQIWSIKRNELKIFEKDVGEYLLSKYGFLIRVQPHEIDKYRKMQEEKEYKCNVCEFETNTLLAYQQHMKSHNMSPEAQAMIASMETAQPDGELYTAQDAQAGKPQFQAQPDQYDGAPVGGTYTQPMVDADGVEWVGPGSQKKRGMKLRPKFGAAGVFRGGGVV